MKVISSRSQVVACIVAGIVAVGTLTASAALGDGTTLSYVDCGWYNPIDGHISDNTNYATGSLFSREYRSWFLFDLSAVTAEVNGAELRLYNPPGPESVGGYVSDDPTETLVVFDVTTPIPTLRAGAVGPTAAFDDLGSGVAFGTQDVSVADNGQVVGISLNPAGVAALNSARGGEIAFGVAATTIGSGLTEAVFLATNDAAMTRELVLHTTCGNGMLDAGEQCDDGNTQNGDCCDANCHDETTGSACDDATLCNGHESCDGAGTCVPGTAPSCDDGNGCTADACDPLIGCINDDAPSTGCLTSDKSMLMLKRTAGGAKDKLLWKWLKGAAFSRTDLGDPTGSTGYALCVYAGTTQALVGDAALPPGGGWSASGASGYKFKGTSPDGLSLALLKGGVAGKSKALAKGKGAALPDVALPLIYPVTVQLKRDGAPWCLESTFGQSDEKKNDLTQFKAKR